MQCSKCQYQLATEDAAVIAADQALQAHLAECADCTQFAEEIRAVSRATRSLAELTTPSSFSQSVSARVAATTQRSSRLERLIGPLRAPAPVLQTRHMLAGVAALVLFALVLALALHPMGAQPATSGLDLPTLTQPAGGVPVNYDTPVDLKERIPTSRTPDVVP